MENDGDFFCEQRLWRKYDVNPAAADPVCMTTGIFMMLMPFIPNARPHQQRLPVQFHMCKAALALVGFGTIIFHYFSAEHARRVHVNYQLCDWLPITLMASSIIVLYFCNLFPRLTETQWTVLLFSVLVWSSALAILMDTDTRDYYTAATGSAGDQNTYGTALNLALLLPLSLTLMYACWANGHHLRDIWPLWASLAVVLFLWVSNAYACADTPELSMFHAAYHIVVAYAFVYAACLGVCADSAHWELTHTGWCCWPMIIERQYPTIPYTV